MNHSTRTCTFAKSAANQRVTPGECLGILWRLAVLPPPIALMRAVSRILRLEMIAVVILLAHAAAGYATERAVPAPARDAAEANRPIGVSANVAEGKEADNRDAPPDTPNRLTPTLFWGGKIKGKVEYENNFDLSDAVDDDRGIIQLKLEGALSYLIADNVLGFVSFQLKRENKFVEEGVKKNLQTELELKRAHFTFRDVAGGISAQLGRQKFKDQREWFLDETLDAIRLRYKLGDLELELGAGRQDVLVQKNLLDPDEKTRTNTYLLLGEYGVDKNISLTGYGIIRDDRTGRDGRPMFFGLRSIGEIDISDDEIQYWIDLAMVRGDDNGTDIKGYGFDVGATYKFDLPLRPYFTAGYAFGSGDSDPDTGADKEFRQTGLEGNQDKFGGVTSFKYYGETFDPELRNLKILTVGVGFRPTKDSSIDSVYHTYRQDELSDKLRGSPLDLDPNEDGTRPNKSLGSEIDVIIGLDDIVPGVDVELAFGHFFAGEALRVEIADDVFADADDAFFARFEIGFSF